MLGLTGYKWAFRRTTAAQRRRVEEALESMHVTEFAGKRLSELSGGQRQRLAIAEALVARPKLLMSTSRWHHWIYAASARRRATSALAPGQGRHNSRRRAPFESCAELAQQRDLSTRRHAHYDTMNRVLDDALLSHIYGTPIEVAATRGALHQERLMTTSLVAVGYQEDWWLTLTSPFMRDALLGGTIVALAAGLIGYFVVIRNTAFAAHALAEIGLPGATGAVLVGLPVAFGLGVFCVGGALVIGALGKRAAERDVATGTVLAMAIGLALLFNSLATKASSTMTNILFGNLLAISHGQLVTFAGLLILLAVSIGFIYRPLLFASVNRQVAEAERRTRAGVVDHLHGAAGARGDDGRSSRWNLAALRPHRHTRRDCHHADTQAQHRHAHLDDHQHGVGLGRARGVGHVQSATELCHRGYRLHSMVRRVGGKSPRSTERQRLWAGFRPPSTPDAGQLLSARGISYSTRINRPNTSDQFVTKKPACDACWCTCSAVVQAPIGHGR